ncbi:MAG: hypothetical protein U5Q03_13510 [Bacteroidota bacterium]|nr:hypothetical protein [Bacteroidota bacterium]
MRLLYKSLKQLRIYPILYNSSHTRYGSRLFLINKQEIQAQHVSEAVDNILVLKADYYWELINKQTAYRKKVLHTLSQVKRGLFSDEIARKYNLGAASSTQKALDSFIEEGIIERNNAVYEFSDPFFKKFIQNNI